MAAKAKDYKAMARELAAKGRGDDHLLVHMTPAEVIALSRMGGDHGEMTFNPDTGLPEAGFLKFLLPLLGSIAMPMLAPALGITSALGTAALGGVGSAVGTKVAGGDWNQALMSGIMGFGGNMALNKLAGMGGAGVTPGVDPSASVQGLTPSAGMIPGGSAPGMSDLISGNVSTAANAAIPGAQGIMAAMPSTVGGRLAAAGANLTGDNLLSTLTSKAVGLPLLMGAAGLAGYQRPAKKKKGDVIDTAPVLTHPDFVRESIWPYEDNSQIGFGPERVQFKQTPWDDYWAAHGGTPKQFAEGGDVEGDDGKSHHWGTKALLSGLGGGILGALTGIGPMMGLIPALGLGGASIYEKMRNDHRTRQDQIRDAQTQAASQAAQPTVALAEGGLISPQMPIRPMADPQGLGHPGMGPAGMYSRFGGPRGPVPETGGYPSMGWFGRSRMMSPMNRDTAPSGIGAFMSRMPVTFAEGGVVGSQAHEAALAQVRQEAAAALMGQNPRPNVAIRRFVELFGMPALEQLQQQIQQQSGGEGRMVKGPGGGMDDAVPAHIDGQEPAALSDGEFVVPADVVSGLGDGSSDEGARRLISMMSKVRQRRTGSAKQPKPMHPSVMPA